MAYGAARETGGYQPEDHKRGEDQMSQEDKKKRRKKQQSIFEKEVGKIVEQSIKATVDQAMKDIFKDWK